MRRQVCYAQILWLLATINWIALAVWVQDKL